jgi:hypothetical protein
MGQDERVGWQDEPSSDDRIRKPQRRGAMRILSPYLRPALIRRRAPRVSFEPRPEYAREGFDVAARH